MYSQWKKSKDYMVDEDEELGLDPFGLICGNSAYSNKRIKPKFLYFIFFSLVSCSLVLAPLLLSFGSNFSLLCKSFFLIVSWIKCFSSLIYGCLLFFFCCFADSAGADKEGLGSETDVNGFLCSSVPSG